MKRSRASLARLLSSASSFITVLIFASLATGGNATAATENILWSFGNGSDGAMTGTKQFGEDVNGVLPGLISDGAGNLYGTTPLGGAYGGPLGNGGTVFKLSPPSQAGGAWTELVLYNFGATPSDGLHPWGGVKMDANGNLFGTTLDGGVFGKGSVFKLSPPATPGGKWTEAVLFNFNGGNPVCQLLIDGGGNLYGATLYGVVAFELSPPSSSNTGWTETVIAQSGSGIDFAELVSGFISDPIANLYGTSTGGGSFGAGTVFESSPPSTLGGSWNNAILWSFGGNTIPTDGQGPRAGLIIDSSGNLYGSTPAAGSAGRGTVFELSPPVQSGGAWSETILSAFVGSYNSGTAPSEPDGGVVMNANGNLFGTTTNGGTGSRGTVFALAHPSTPGGPWTQSILWNFGSTGGTGKSNKLDGSEPRAHLLLDGSGNLYGTTHTGGAYGRGTVFEVSNTGL